MEGINYIPMPGAFRDSCPSPAAVFRRFFRFPRSTSPRRTGADSPPGEVRQEAAARAKRNGPGDVRWLKPFPTGPVSLGVAGRVRLLQARPGGSGHRSNIEPWMASGYNENSDGSSCFRGFRFVRAVRPFMGLNFKNIQPSSFKECAVDDHPPHPPRLEAQGCEVLSGESGRDRRSETIDLPAI